MPQSVSWWSSSRCRGRRDKGTRRWRDYWSIRAPTGLRGFWWTDAAVVGDGVRARGGGYAATLQGQRRPKLERSIRSDAVTMGSIKRARGGGEAVARERRRRSKLEGHFSRLYAAIVGCKEGGMIR